MGTRKHELTDYELRQRQAGIQDANERDEQFCREQVSELERIAAEVLMGFIQIKPVATPEDAQEAAKRIADEWMKD